jgi:acetyltransferase-like isoleucine patch superfamily enzyme
MNGYLSRKNKKKLLIPILRNIKSPEVILKTEIVNPKIKQVIKDPFAYFNKLVFTTRLKVLGFVSTSFGYFFLRIKGIKIDRGCKFWGLPSVIRVPGSLVVIGHSCNFRSSPISNLVGLNRKCTIYTMHRGAEIHIGSHSGFSGVVINCSKRIKIGENVLVGANTSIMDTDWHPERSSLEADPVIIEDNVWLGINCVVLKGVKIGSNSIIGANSVVTKDVPSNCIAAGNPCRIIKKI